MREILYRGKRVDNGEWIEGFYLLNKNKNKEENYIFDGKCSDGVSLDYYDIDKNTLGQYTGLLDKNGKKIFIGDIVELFCKGSREHKRYEVFYDIETGQLLMRNGNDVEQLYGQLARNNLTIIGNIYDNPKLLEEQ